MKYYVYYDPPVNKGTSREEFLSKEEAEKFVKERIDYGYNQNPTLVSENDEQPKCIYYDIAKQRYAENQ